MAPDTSKIFISYSRKDTEFALRLGNDLKAKGVNVWLDQLDIKPGTIWDTEVEEALENSERFLIILSPESVASVNVKDELSFALDEHKEIIPVLMKECKVPFRIRRRQHIDFSKDYEAGLYILLKLFSFQGQTAKPPVTKKNKIVAEKAGNDNLSKTSKAQTEQKRKLEKKRIAKEQDETITDNKKSGEILWADSKNGYFIDQRDQAKYKVVKIGNQIWMAENLKATKYNDGNAIQLVKDSAEWGQLTTAAYCWYNNDESAHKNTYGALYNWHAVKTGKLCPKGWHVPTDEEWKQLEMNLGMDQSNADDNGYRGTDEGIKLKSTSGWNEGGNGTDMAGFKALPGGLRRDDVNFIDLGNNGNWWSATEEDSNLAWSRNLNCSVDIVTRDYHRKGQGFSVRCVRD